MIGNDQHETETPSPPPFLSLTYVLRLLCMACYRVDLGQRGAEKGRLGGKGLTKNAGRGRPNFWGHPRPAFNHFKSSRATVPHLRPASALVEMRLGVVVFRKVLLLFFLVPKNLVSSSAKGVRLKNRTA